jgi:hypothetical protein
LTPRDLIGFGYKNIQKFEALAAGNVSQNLKNFVAKTAVELQVGLENALANNHDLARSRKDLLDVAYASHTPTRTCEAASALSR